MLPTNTNDSLVILVGNVKGDRSWHFLLNKVETVLSCFVLTADDIDVEIILVESIENDLYIALKMSALPDGRR